MLNLYPLLKQLTIKPKELTARSFDLDYIDPRRGDLGWAQRPFIKEIERQHNTGRPTRIIVLKARQLGISTVTAGVLYWWSFIYPGSNGLIMAHEREPTTELFETSKRFWETWPYRKFYKLRYNTKQNMNWDNGSKLRIATARNVGGGRASTITAVHASEVAFYNEPEELMVGLMQALPSTPSSLMVMESTANGMGNWFYDQWNEAVEGKTDFIPMFFPWFGHSEYRRKDTFQYTDLDKEEKDLFKIMTLDHVFPLTPQTAMAALSWRRWAIPNRAHGDVDFFMQEYPATPEEAFITSGRPIFPWRILRDNFQHQEGIRGFLAGDYFSTPRFIQDNRDPTENTLTIFKAPRRGDARTDRYFVAGDPSETIPGDPACIQVINRQTLEQVAVWHGRIEPVPFAHEMMKIGRFYNGAMVCPEIEGGGQAAIGAIIQANYPNIWADKRPDRIRGSTNVFGWWTNYQRKMWAIGNMQSLLSDSSLTIHDIITYNQLLNYVERDNGEYGNANPDIHDDSVMALAIGITASMQEGPFMADREGENVILDIFNQEQEFTEDFEVA